MTVPARSFFAEGQAAHAAGQAGDFRLADALLARLAAADDEEARAWAGALRAQRWNAEPERGALPPLREVAELAGTSGWARSAAALACAEVEHACIRTFDLEALQRWIAVHRSLLSGGEMADASAWLRLAEAWFDLARGAATSAISTLEEIGQDRTVRAIAPLGIEAVALRALCLATVGDLEGATISARRASRMARTEALPQSEYIANVILARVRRLTGRPHLATRILTALLDVAPSSWRGWIQWELLMAAGLDVPARLDGEPAANGPGMDWAHLGATTLRTLLEAAGRGDRAAFDDAAEALRATIGHVAPTAHDAGVAVFTIDPKARIADAPDPGLARYLGAETTTPPPEVRGLSAHATGGSPGDGTTVWVVAGPGVEARRVAPVGAALSGASARIAPSRGRTGRVETAVAALAIAGTQGLDVHELFRIVYGFDHEPGAHRDLLKMLIHRARAAVGGAGQIVRDGARVRLDLEVSLLVPDPRSEQSLEDLVLRLLSPRGGSDARSVAKALAIPLRTVQAAIQRLVEEGEIRVEQTGRRFSYSVEDTTFSEPTRF